MTVDEAHYLIVWHIDVVVFSAQLVEQVNALFHNRFEEGDVGQAFFVSVIHSLEHVQEGRCQQCL